ANSVIVGGVSVGNNVTIGASTLILKDIPDNCIAIGNPAKIIPKI
ncbi:TPA: N-acetyltransferase, partial [Klebsiella variicola]|nr:N-acetyltransferase [Klebsiella variicola]